MNTKNNGHTKKWMVHTRSTKAGWRKIFFDALAQVPNVTRACKVAHISVATVFRLRRDEPGFGQKWEEALQKGVEGLEATAWHRANEGSEDWTWVKDHNGRLVKKPLPPKASDTLAIFLLKAHKPDKYRESFKAEVSGPDGAALVGNTTIVIAWPHDLPTEPNPNTPAIPVEATVGDPAPAPHLPDPGPADPE